MWEQNGVSHFQFQPTPIERERSRRRSEMSDEGDSSLSGLESDSDGEPWQPNQEMLLSLLEMGISENAAKRGLYHTDNESVQAAAAYIFEQPSNAVNAPFDPELSDDGDDRDYKMVFVVNAGLGMGVGKIAALVGSGRQGGMWSRLDPLPRGKGS